MCRHTQWRLVTASDGGLQPFPSSLFISCRREVQAEFPTDFSKQLVEKMESQQIYHLEGLNGVI